MEDPNKKRFRNLTWKDSEEFPKRGVLNRAISVTTDRVQTEVISPKYKTANGSLSVAWKNWKEKQCTTESEDEDFEIVNMELGWDNSPPAADLEPFFESMDTISDELSVQICKESIRSNLQELMKASVGNIHVLEDIEGNSTPQENLLLKLRNISLNDRNIIFLWCAFLKKGELLKCLLDIGVDIHYSEPFDGFTALHLTAFSGCVNCSKFLITKGVDVNHCKKLYTPLHSAVFGNSFEVAKMLINNGAKIEGTEGSSLSVGTPLHSAVKANALECIQLLIGEGADVNSVEKLGLSPVHLAAYLGRLQCLKLLFEQGKVDPNITTRDKQATALHLAAEDGYVDCVKFILSKNCDVGARNYRGQTALHMAAKAQSVDCVETLLKLGNCDPNVVDNEKRTPLHSAVGKALLAYETAEKLIKWRADVNAKDKYGYTPLHVAALNELSQCVETLIYHGADITARTKGGVSALGIIARKIPVSLDMLYQKLDQAICMHDPEASNKEVELKLDFRILLQHSNKGEIGFLKTFVDEGQKEILEHPLCEAFLQLKWEKIRKFYIARLMFFALFVISLTLYVIFGLSKHCFNKSKGIVSGELENSVINGSLCSDDDKIGKYLSEHGFVIEIIWVVLVIFTMCEIIRKSFGLMGYSSIQQYFSQPENVTEWFIIISVFLVSCIYTGRTYMWQNHIAAFSLLFGWANMMILIGQLPVLGSYVAMYIKVQIEFLKLLVAYSCLLIGFTVSFCVVFPVDDNFSNPFVGFVKVLVMMTGELEAEDIIAGKDEFNNEKVMIPITGRLIFVIFLLFVTIVLMNLLIGIAVHDIQGLKKTARLTKLVRQTNLISYIEQALFNKYLPSFLLRLLRQPALISPSAYRVVLNVKPLNPREKRLPKEVLWKAHEVAKIRRQINNTLSSQGSACTVTTNVTKSSKFRGSIALKRKKTYHDVFNPPDITEIQTLANEVEKSSKNVEKLSQEIRNLYAVIKVNQTIIKDLVESLNKKGTTES